MEVTRVQCMLTYPIENSLTLICAVWNDFLRMFSIFNVSLLSNCSIVAKCFVPPHFQRSISQQQRALVLLNCRFEVLAYLSTCLLINGMTSHRRFVYTLSF